MRIYKKLLNEITFFKYQALNTRTLLLSNMLSAMILPIIDIFAGAYIMQKTGSLTFVVIYQLFVYVGILTASLLNGVFLRRFKVGTLYSFGIMLTAISMILMMFIQSLGIVEVGLAGFALGSFTGLFWTNRYLLTLNSTNDENRNYFFGIESFFFSIWSVLIPFVGGVLLGNIDGKVVLGQIVDINSGYQIITVLVFAIAVAACVILSNGKFENPVQKEFFYVKFHSLWNKMVALASLKGMVQGFLVTTPAILVMKLVGNEGSLGLIQGIGGAATAVLVYVLGRMAKPKHRMLIFGFGLVVFFIGTLMNGILFSVFGVIVFVLCKLLFQPIHDLAYYPTMMKAIDVVSKIEKRNEYAYILSHEIGMFVGRAFGMLMFIALAYFGSEIFALKYALIIVGGLQLLSLPLAKSIVKVSNSTIDEKVETSDIVEIEPIFMRQKEMQEVNT